MWDTGKAKLVLRHFFIISRWQFFVPWTVHFILFSHEGMLQEFIPGSMLLFAEGKVGFLILLYLKILENMCSVVC